MINKPELLERYDRLIESAETLLQSTRDIKYRRFVSEFDIDFKRALTNGSLEQVIRNYEKRFQELVGVEL